jgi:hypothetical protein
MNMESFTNIENNGTSNSTHETLESVAVEVNIFCVQPENTCSPRNIRFSYSRADSDYLWGLK